MSQPSMFPEADSPKPNDTTLRKWMKILGAYQNKAGALPANDPQIGMTLRTVKIKVLKAIRGES